MSRDKPPYPWFGSLHSPPAVDPGPARSNLRGRAELFAGMTSPALPELLQPAASPAADDPMACALLEGQVVGVEDLPPGWADLRPNRRPPLTCLHCGGALTARGRRFVHVRAPADGSARPPGAPSAAQACEAARNWHLRQAGETDWHRGAKQVLVGTTGMRLPAIVQDGRVLAPERWVEGEDFAVQGLEVPLEALPGSRRRGIRLDAFALAYGQPLGLEITVTHALDEAKLALAARLGVPLLEIDLRDQAHQPWDPQICRILVVEGVHRKRWHLPADRPADRPA